MGMIMTVKQKLPAGVTLSRLAANSLTPPLQEEEEEEEGEARHCWLN